MDLTRRRFLGFTSVLAANPLDVLGSLAPAQDIKNPLAHYPERGWEKIYLDQYRYDSSFTWICAPNDTHMCRMRAFVRNGVMIRSEQNYKHQGAGDLYGNRAT